jgi:hypothetical protein
MGGISIQAASGQIFPVDCCDLCRKVAVLHPIPPCACGECPDPQTTGVKGMCGKCKAKLERKYRKETGQDLYPK